MDDNAYVKELARRIISHHFGGDPFRLSVEGGGLNNHVVTVQHGVGDFVVRIRPDDSDVGIYLKEKWATARAREAGVPAPEVLEVACEAVPRACMIARKSAGQPATKRTHGSKIVREMGRYAAIVNAIPTRGFGATFDWADAQAPRRHDWKDFLDRELEVEEKLEVLESNRVLGANARRKVRRVLESAASDSAAQTLNHGDLRMKNLLVGKDGHISAILDWENCTSNVPPIASSPWRCTI